MDGYAKAQSRDVHSLELKNEKELRHFVRLVDNARNRRDRILDKGVLKAGIVRQKLKGLRSYVSLVTLAPGAARRP